ncbi:MAG: pyk [Gammaproteobacteria bacterium]|jgi:pyruvate kinase|nr:pyk [Gammaproteobacteria bacterium]
MIRRTKIIATLGPATDEADMLEHILQAGVDLVRINFSHGKAQDHERRIAQARAISQKIGKEIGVIADLQGPKIRVARFQAGKIQLLADKRFILDAALASDAGTAERVGIDYKALPNDVHAGDTLLLDDGRLVLEVEQVVGHEIHCLVKVGGELSNHKGINRQGGGLSANALTDKDREDLSVAVRCGADYIAVSFVRNEEDIAETRKLLNTAHSTAGIIAKIERIEAITNLESIIHASDAVMVARGDLAVEIGDAEVPGVQKHIIHRARVANKAVITATQMMESMIHSPVPTRAEVSDVANAVLDGSDAVMLSAETATGAHPAIVVAAMARICVSAEKQPRASTSKHRIEMRFKRADEAIAMATMYTANHLDIKAIIALTESGSTPLWMSRIRSGIPIYGLSRHIITQRRMTLYRGVYPLAFDITQYTRDDVNKAAANELEKLSLVSTGDLVILTKGDLVGKHGGTNALKILQIGEIY